MGGEAATRARVRKDIVRLAQRGVGLTELTRRVTGALQRAVPFEGTCLLTVDPTTLLPTGEVIENGLPPAARLRLTEIEFGEPDFNTFAALARADVPAASLSGSTGGQLDRSTRQREVRRPHGFGDELRSVLGGPTGTWGTLTLLRESGRPNFTAADVGFVASLSAPLADAVRRATLLEEVLADTDAAPTGFLVLTSDDTIELANDSALRWLDELAEPDRPSGPLPVAVRAAVARTRHVAHGGDGASTVRVRTRTGHWVVVRGSQAGAGRVAVLIESGSAGRAGLGDRRRLWHHRSRAGGRRAGGARSVDQRDRRTPAPVRVHRAGPPEGHLRQVGHQLTR